MFTVHVPVHVLKTKEGFQEHAQLSFLKSLIFLGRPTFIDKKAISNIADSLTFKSYSNFCVIRGLCHVTLVAFLKSGHLIITGVRGLLSIFQKVWQKIKGENHRDGPPFFLLFLIVNPAMTPLHNSEEREREKEGRSLVCGWHSTVAVLRIRNGIRILSGLLGE